MSSPAQPKPAYVEQSVLSQSLYKDELEFFPTIRETKKSKNAHITQMENFHLQVIKIAANIIARSECNNKMVFMTRQFTNKIKKSESTFKNKTKGKIGHKKSINSSSITKNKFNTTVEVMLQKIVNFKKRKKSEGKKTC